jgi:GH25 family lysozyme M1 (1,4-beta-N-acetylmuramidase)
MTVLLPDLSEFQPHADMEAIKAVNGGAAIIRACYGTSHPDHAFAHLRAAAAGFPFLGIYQYVVAGQDIASQAKAFAAIVGKLGPHEVPIADIEEGSGSQEARAVAWLGLVGAATGKRPWLYSGLSYAESHGLAPIFNGPEIHTWVAAYGSVEPSLGHTLWQSTDGQKGSHITNWPGAGRCDTNVYHGTLAELSALVTPKTLPKRVPQLETIVTDGTQSLHDLAAARGTHAMHVLYLTSDHFGGFPQEVANWGNRLFDPGMIVIAAGALPMPAGLHLRVPVIPS